MGRLKWNLGLLVIWVVGMTLARVLGMAELPWPAVMVLGSMVGAANVLGIVEGETRE